MSYTQPNDHSKSSETEILKDDDITAFINVRRFVAKISFKAAETEILKDDDITAFINVRRFVAKISFKAAETVKALNT